MAKQIRVLQLDEGKNYEKSLYRLSKGWVIRFTLGPSLQPYVVHLSTNYPLEGKEFVREQHRELKWINPRKCLSDDGDRYAEIIISTPGSFHFKFRYSSTAHRPPVEKAGYLYFVVEPTLLVGNNEVLPLDSICAQTVLSKCLGPFYQWYDRLRVAKETGYNLIHFTPIQELGGSKSSYSLHNQLEVNSSFSTPEMRVTFDDIATFISKMNREFKMLAVVDIVLNHTANDTPWLKQHPEAAYNLDNSPHLKPAFILDKALWDFTCDVAKGKWESHGVPAAIVNEDQIQAVGRILRDIILPPLKFREFYCLDVDRVVEGFREKIQTDGVHSCSDDSVTLRIVQDKKFRKLESTIDMEAALRLFNIERPGLTNEDRVNQCCAMLREALEVLNKEKEEEVAQHLFCGVHNVMANLRYERVEDRGPKIPVVSEEHPVVTRYFIDQIPDPSSQDAEKLMYGSHARFIMAHQGWVMGGDPLNDFAAPESFVYLRRELIPWGDSVKLHYGRRPEDSPYLWKHMMQYVEISAQVFHGFRLDNCHSTPTHVAQYFLDAARKVRPDLYVIAELFTSSEELDNIFVNRLGINSCIREAMSASNSHEEGRLVYRYGGEPVGAFYQPPCRPLVPSIAHALYMDQTHDNPCPIQVRSVHDSLPSAALVSMACCATGSTRGYDELVPKHIHVVKENRLYMSWPNKSNPSREGYLSPYSGILSARRALNQLHQRLAKDGFTQVYVDQMTEHMVAVTRHNFETHETVVLAAHTAFHPPPPEQCPTYKNPRIPTYGLPPIKISKYVRVDEIILEAKILHHGPKEEMENPDFINGLSAYAVELQEHIPLSQSQVCCSSHDGSADIQLSYFPPGSVLALKLSMKPDVHKALTTLRELIYAMYGKTTNHNSSDSMKTKLDTIVSKLGWGDMCRVLYHCDAEERDDGKGGGVYDVPDMGPLPYCGLQGMVSSLAKIHQFNDLGHPFCHNLREGDWMIGYTAQRLLWHEGTKELGEWFRQIEGLISQLPRYLTPSYFDGIVCGVYIQLLNHIWHHMSKFVQEGSQFVRGLSLGSVQLMSVSKNAPLPELSPNLSQPYGLSEEMLTMAAGLPHFSTGFMRAWGRDTFIALRGLLLVTGRFDNARKLLLGFAATTRFGLIPNLLAGGAKARYNCRDAVWWWLQCIQSYCLMSEEGLDFLSVPVRRMYLTDDSVVAPDGNLEHPLYEVIQEVMCRHFVGISFREPGAGPDLDRDMKPDGFNVTAGIDPTTGFVQGGCQWNCGTWMDKVGESEMAGNKGVPATARDGSAVELVGLCKSTVRWLAKLYDDGDYPYPGVTKRNPNGQTISLSFKEWNQKLMKSFEANFWISSDPDPDKEGDDVKLINRRGIYKDTVGSTAKYTDFQLRPNFPIAMTVAPELFDPEHAWEALCKAEENLLGPLGMKTLDPSDWSYRGVYDNSNDSFDFMTARGFNYHQGPEWLWCLGPFLRAKLLFASMLDKEKKCLTPTIEKMQNALRHHKQLITDSPYRGLPELTNVGGESCKDSCAVQAWSMACLLEVLYDLDQILRKTRSTHAFHHIWQ